MVVRDRVLRPAELPGYIAGDLRGLVTYRIDADDCEIVSLDSLDQGRGVGSRLVEAVVETARSAGCRRVWLVTTNDNERALSWYVRRGFRVSAIRVGALDRARTRKPSIPVVNAETGIAIRDEIELERRLG
jgi:GNAT superfamily N-acetyltransferase